MTAQSSHYEQACRPSGWVGRVFGHTMALLNRGMAQRGFRALDLAPSDRVLEIGFGPGVLIELMASVVTRGEIVGVDHSEEMRGQALRRVRRRGVSERVRLISASVSSLPFESERFDKICAVNTIQFWPQPVDDLREVRRALREGGRLVLVGRANEPSLANEFSRSDSTAPFMRRVAGHVKQAGFRDVSLSIEGEGWGRTACVVARR